jgi:hypothetical protein
LLSPQQDWLSVHPFLCTVHTLCLHCSHACPNLRNASWNRKWSCFYSKYTDNCCCQVHWTFEQTTHFFSPAIYISYVDDLSAVFFKLIIPLKRPWDGSWSSQYCMSHNGAISPPPSAKFNLQGQVCCYPLSISLISTEPNKIVWANYTFLSFSHICTDFLCTILRWVYHHSQAASTSKMSLKPLLEFPVLYSYNSTILYSSKDWFIYPSEH